MFYRVIRRLFLLLAAPMFRLRVEGIDRVPAEGAGIVVAPHRSWLDPPAIGGACPRRITFLMTDRIYETRGLGWFYRGMGALPVSREGRLTTRALREALRRLHRGELIGIFPEGRVVRPGETPKVHPGAAMLAVRSGAPVIPVGLRGTARAWPHGRRLPRPGPVSVHFGEPIAIRPGARDAALDAISREIAVFLDRFGHEGA